MTDTVEAKSKQLPLVVVVDDEPEWRMLLETQLKQAGYTVRSTGEAADAFDLIADLQPVAVTCDVMMPHIDGWSLVAALKSDPRTASIPVIMVTSSDDTGLVPIMQVTDFLTKPVQQEALVATLSRLDANAASKRVLVIEDEETTRHILTHGLSAAGWEVVEARHGGEAITCLSQAPFALVLLDLMMPEVDGFEFLQRTRDDKRLADTPIIVLTGKKLSESERRLLARSVHRVVGKDDAPDTRGGASKVVDLVYAVAGQQVGDGAESA